MIDVELPEWSFVDASVDKRLASRGLLDARSREIAARLAQRRELEITTREDGLAIRSLAHVGRIELNDVRITIRPKVSPQMLLELLRYAYSLRNLHLIDSSTFDSGDRGLQDLLIAQLHAEARELLARGLGRRYVRCAGELGSPRGRIMVDRLARARSPLVATLPCTHHPRSSDFLLNRVLRSGLELARQLAQSRDLKQAIARTAQIFADLAQVVPLHRETIRAAESAVDRLSLAYAPALRLIRLIHEGSHLDLEGGASLKLKGFLFDMNRFFQALLSRFLRENLPDCEVVDELPLRELMAYSPGFNPRNRRAPLPRPDFVVRQRRAPPQLLDAKYRDIWETDLPREMLYQLAVYAMSQPQGATAAILYPTGATAARESIIEIREPATTSIRAFVALRPVIVPQVLELLRANGDRQRDREMLARKLVFGAADVG